MEQGIKTFPYTGGKQLHMDWLQNLLPKTDVFIDVFGGSAGVLCGRTPSNIEFYNDINKNLVNLFEVLRNDDELEELIYQLNLTPYSHSEFKSIVINDADSKIERARKWFFVNYCSIFGEHKRLMKIRIANNRANSFRNQIKQLSLIGKRVKDIEISNMDYVEFLAWLSIRLSYMQITSHSYNDVLDIFCVNQGKFKALIYCDPPYLTKDTKDIYQKNAFNFEDHKKLSEILHQKTNESFMVAVSAYDSDYYDTLYPLSSGWYKHSIKQHKPISGYNNTAIEKQLQKQTQALYTNYQAENLLL